MVFIISLISINISIGVIMFVFPDGVFSWSVFAIGVLVNTLHQVGRPHADTKARAWAIDGLFFLVAFGYLALFVNSRPLLYPFLLGVCVTVLLFESSGVGHTYTGQN
ncbi:hypothetical protein [Natronorubrum sp. DTA28]|uniref:hypothetical protein n=1 Tax=Natronorubrum sp. DTA28 TaxID=3447019 RepID=UPI003F8368A0